MHAGAELVGAVPVVVGGKFGEAGRLQLVEGESGVGEDLRGGEAGVGVEQAGAYAADEGGFATACVHEAHDEGLIAGADRGAGGQRRKAAPADGERDGAGGRAGVARGVGARGREGVGALREGDVERPLAVGVGGGGGECGGAVVHGDRAAGLGGAGECRREVGGGVGGGRDDGLGRCGGIGAEAGEGDDGRRRDGVAEGAGGDVQGRLRLQGLSRRGDPGGDGGGGDAGDGKLLRDGEGAVVDGDDGEARRGEVAKGGDAERAGVVGDGDAEIAGAGKAAELGHDVAAWLGDAGVVEQAVGGADAFPPDVGAHVADVEAVDDLLGRADGGGDGLIVDEKLGHPRRFAERVGERVVADDRAVEVSTDIGDVGGGGGVVEGGVADGLFERVGLGHHDGRLDVAGEIAAEDAELLGGPLAALVVGGIEVGLVLQGDDGERGAGGGHGGDEAVEVGDVVGVVLGEEGAVDGIVVGFERGRGRPWAGEEACAASVGALAVGDAGGVVAVGRDAHAQEGEPELEAGGAEQVVHLGVVERVLAVVEEGDAGAEAVDLLADRGGIDGAAGGRDRVGIEGAIDGEAEVACLGAVDPGAILVGGAAGVGVGGVAQPVDGIGAADAGDLQDVHAAGVERHLVGAGEIEAEQAVGLGRVLDLEAAAAAEFIDAGGVGAGVGRDAASELVEVERDGV